MVAAVQETLLDGVNFYFGGGAAAMNLHERLADLLLMELSFSMEDPGKKSLNLRSAAQGCSHVDYPFPHKLLVIQKCVQAEV